MSHRATIRPATPDDAEALADLIRELARYERLEHLAQATVEQLRNHLFGDRVHAEALVADRDGAPVGFALFFHNFSTFRGQPGIYLEDLFVLPQHRGLGIGKDLLRAVAARAVERGCGRLEWAVLDWNEPAIAFYKKLGARALDEWTSYRLDEEALHEVGRSSSLGSWGLGGPADLWGGAPMLFPFHLMQQLWNPRPPETPTAPPPPLGVQPHIERMSGYVPGEQPRDPSEIIKLNTNENPYPPSPRVAKAIREALDGRLRLYPDPLATAFRQTAAQLHGVEPDMILVGNGSDDLLTILTRAFVGTGETVVYPTPSYILYRTLTKLQNAQPVEVPFEPDWSLDPARFAVPGARLTFLANPNSPSGTALSPAALAKLARQIEGPLIVDEAYVAFADSDAVGLIADHPNVIVTRTLSKGHSLAGLRIGYLIARPEIIRELVKVKDSYNCDALSLLGGAAALEDEAHLAKTRAKILATRRRLTAATRSLGYQVPESQANFVWCTGGPPASEVYEALKARKILVRLMRYDGLPDALRITVGTDDQIDQLLAALSDVLGGDLGAVPDGD